MRVLILANGDPPAPAFARQMAREHDLMLATDGAAHTAHRLGLTPDIICGDFDSVDRDRAEREHPAALWLATPDQEAADLEKALHLAVARGAQSVTILGGLGGRIDHTMGSLLLPFAFASLPITLRDERARVLALDATSQDIELVLDAAPGDTLSLFTLDAAVFVQLEGVRWPLHDEVLPLGTRGVSNVVTTSPVCLRVRGGRLWVCCLTNLV